jgi:hypothetical protein
MTSMSRAVSDAMGRALETRAATPAPAPASSVALFVAPVLTDELRRELERIIAGPLDLDGFRLCHEPAWHPNADQAADHLRAGMRQSASPDVVAMWLRQLAPMVANAPADQAGAESAVVNIWMLCSDLPAAVWSIASLQAYCRQCKFWPSPADLLQFMEARAKRIEREIAGLDGVARAPRTPQAAVCGSTKYRDAQVASSPPDPMRESIHATGPEIIAPMRSVAEQLAALGISDDAATMRAKLAEIAARRGAKP